MLKWSSLLCLGANGSQTPGGGSTMAKIISIINQKGGVGKTTTAVNLSALMADMGQRVLLIDLDPQGNATSGLGMAVEDKSAYEVLMGRIQMGDLVEKTEFKNLSIAGSDIRLAGAELELVRDDELLEHDEQDVIHVLLSQVPMDDVRHHEMELPHDCHRLC